MAKVVVQLTRQGGSTDEQCVRFIKRLRDRIYNGPPKRRDPNEVEDEVEKQEVDLSDPFQEIIFNTDLTWEEAKKEVEEAAPHCDPSWQALYKIKFGEDERPRA